MQVHGPGNHFHADQERAGILSMAEWKFTACYVIWKLLWSSMKETDCRVALGELEAVRWFCTHLERAVVAFCFIVSIASYYILFRPSYEASHPEKYWLTIRGDKTLFVFPTNWCADIVTYLTLAYDLHRLALP